MASSRKDKIVRFAKKNKFNRYLIIALLAVVIFLDHLERALSAKKRVAVAYFTAVAFIISMVAPCVLPVLVYAEEIIVKDISIDVTEEKEDDSNDTMPTIPVNVEPNGTPNEETGEKGETEETGADKETVDEGLSNNENQENKDGDVNQPETPDEKRESETGTEDTQNNMKSGFGSIEESVILELRESEEYKMLTDEDWEKILDYAKEYNLDLDHLIEYIQYYIDNIYQPSETTEEKPADEKLDENPTGGNPIDEDAAKEKVTDEESGKEKGTDEGSDDKDSADKETTDEALAEEEAAEEELVDEVVPHTPVANVQAIGFVGDDGHIMGGANAGISITVPDMEMYDLEQFSEATGVYTNVYSGYYPIENGSAFMEFESGFCGNVDITPVDNDGNLGETISYSVIIDRTAPDISISQTVLDDGTVVANINVNDEIGGDSGIGETDLWVDGVLLEDNTALESNYCSNGIGREVIASQRFEYHAEKNGTSIITVVAYDSVGNSTDYTEIVKVKKQYSEMSMRAPSQVELMLDPWNINGKGTLHSNEFQIVNNSEYDVKVDLNSMLLSVEREAESSLGDMKNVEMSVVILNTGETIRLTEGASHEVFSVVLPCKENGNNTLILQFVGKISEGSEMLWDSGDINMDLLFKYTPSEEDADNKEQNL